MYNHRLLYYINYIHKQVSYYLQNMTDAIILFHIIHIW